MSSGKVEGKVWYHECLVRNFTPVTEAEKGIFPCGFAVVHPWLCDAMGHLSTRHYLGMFDDASYHLFAEFGYQPELGLSESWGWADVRQEISYHAELSVGTLVSVTGAVTGIGRSSLKLQYRLFNRSTEALAATLDATTVCFDLNLRKSRPIPDDCRNRIELIISEK